MSNQDIEMNIEHSVLIPKSKIHPNPWNPNRTTDRQQKAIAESLNQYGQVLEILVRPHPDKEGEYQIIDGEHRYSALPDNVYCNIIHDLDEPNAKKLTIIMNETRGEADKIELCQLLSELNDTFGDSLLNALPYEQGELEELVNMANFDWDSFNTDEETGDNEGIEQEKKGRLCKCPECGHEFIQQL